MVERATGASLRQHLCDDTRDCVGSVVMLTGPVIDPVASRRATSTLEAAELVKELRVVEDLDGARIHAGKHLEVEGRPVELGGLVPDAASPELFAGPPPA